MSLCPLLNNSYKAMRGIKKIVLFVHSLTVYPQMLKSCKIHNELCTMDFTTTSQADKFCLPEVCSKMPICYLKDN